MKRFHYSFIFSLLFLGSTGLFAQSQTNLDKGLRFVEQNAEKWGLVESDYAGALVSDMYTNNKTGVTYIYLVQSHKGIPVNNAITPIIISPEGKVNVTRHGFITNLKEKVNSSKPSLTPLAAIKATVSHLGLQSSDLPTLLRSNSDKNIYEFGQADFSNNEINVELTYVENNGKYNLAWALAIDEKEDSDYFNTFVNASNGQVISKYNYTKRCTFHKDQYSKHNGCSHDKHHNTPMATISEANVALTTAAQAYNVYALPTESPLHAAPITVVDPHFPDSSPYGWHDTNGQEGADYTITRGNNVHAFLDKDDDSFSDNDEPDGGEALVFDAIHDIDGEAVDNEDAATINLFYMNNMMHDVTKRLGFDEQAGNFQVNNYGNGGAGNDYVLAKASAGAELATPLVNNADFGTPPDGDNGRMRMFLWNNPSGLLSVDEPETLAGFIQDVGNAAGANGFGGIVPSAVDAPITGKIVLATDGSVANGTNVCGPVANADEVNGNIAMIDRGLCDFSLKAYNAQEAGAIAVIICNVVGGGGTDGQSSFGMAGGENAADVTIVPLSLGKADCDRIKASILSDIDVSITIQTRAPDGPVQLDGSVDNGIIAHEYGHGISNRLVGGGSNAGCLQVNEQAGEGISDYFSLIMTVEEGDQGTDSRGIGNYADAQTINGRGIRIYPYSTDMSINPRVYDDSKTATNADGSVALYTIGEIWATTLWEIYWGFVDRDGLDTSWDDENAGNFKAARLTIEGMKMGPCNPSLIDMRDAILDADTLFYNGENAELLWTAFAKRGFGYLADDGAGSQDHTDGTQSFEPLPIAIQTLKVQEEIASTLQPGEESIVTVTAQNHIRETQTGVVLTINIPEGLSYVEGSASMTATHENGILTVEVGEMEFDSEVEMTYSVLADGNVKSQTLYYDDVEDPDYSSYDFGAIEGSSLWFESEIANSGEIAWFAGQIDTEVEVDYWMNIPPLQVVGDKPALRFFHRYDTEIGNDGGFLQVSIDGGQSYLDVQDHFIRGGYPIDIAYGTFAIPLLRGFSGSTDGNFVESYLDLSSFSGQEILVRFRFGTNPTIGPANDDRGWYVDDLEMVDLVSYESNTCISSENSEEVQCAMPSQIIIDSDRTTSTKNEELKGFEIGVSPNPASDYVTISLSAEKSTPVVLSLTSIDGRVVKSQAIVAKQEQKIRTFDTSNLAAGMYLIQVKSETGITTKKIVIQ